MKRFNTISNFPGEMRIVDYEDSIPANNSPSVVDKKYFIPLSQQSSGFFRAVDPNAFTFKDGVDDGRPAVSRRRGLDLSEKFVNASRLAEDIKSRSAQYERDVAVANKLKDSKKESRE
jgi:hypothetical protein